MVSNRLIVLLEGKLLSYNMKNKKEAAPKGAASFLLLILLLHYFDRSSIIYVDLSASDHLVACRKTT